MPGRRQARQFLRRFTRNSVDSDSGGPGIGAQFAIDCDTTDPGKDKQREAANPGAEAEGPGKVKCDGDAARDEDRAQGNEHAHAIEKDKRKIVRAEQDQERGIKQVQTKLGDRNKQKHRHRQRKGDLHSEFAQGIAFGGVPFVGEAGPPVKRSSSRVAGKMKKPPKRRVDIAARGVLHVARAADASQTTDETS